MTEDETQMDGRHFVFDMVVISAVVFLAFRLLGRPVRFMRVLVTVVLLGSVIVPPLAPYFGITGLPFDPFPMFLGLPIVWWLAAFAVVSVGVAALYEWLNRPGPPVS
jgi:hypothetical protein